MKKIAFADMTKYGTPPKHVNVVSARFQGEAETGLKSFWMGMSHYLPGGGVEWSGEDSAEEKVYYVLEGELTVQGKDGRSCWGHGTRSISARTRAGRSSTPATSRPPCW